ncbi:succinate dehydrogenase subunit [Trypanosoma cruzi]|uniref:Succinate dehydrogenase subunit n=3 Tax=Trypanosoma cruzi TaxID=5693 RepID=Q4DJE7_TRYCC|nr:hypothetical protein, conserved [Trypanosoma cruzi]ESS64864.1 hypothetical protein TCDM_14529 [Trypanosoma cruzi Dm28c]PBJ75505.1 hypothetical protein BCY84_11084 [Trypanosoma cruzi cruzi]EAN92658.1 hypothetical protein, conserved [Trypanosoma cruzi]KAF8287049.1 succinate dehydrogenase subunit [Trypanosoma cruzi]PBJ79589.1 hypothetical protein BCY84_02612 [Trypanosoma cruzi cruzi]|eukprot:XP_814509.1 hypothetical protein [Trypanosoma cruzi strain CL Brener]
MLRSYGKRFSAYGHMQVRHFTSLQVEKPCATLAEKIVRGKECTVFYRHPVYVMSREKMLNTIWIDCGIFSLSWKALLPYFVLACFFKA